MTRRQRAAPTCEHRPNTPECVLDSAVDYYKGWTVFLVNDETCSNAVNTQFVVAGYDAQENKVTLDRPHGYSNTATLRMSLRWMPNESNNWLGCTKGCYRAYGGKSTTRTNVISLPTIHGWDQYRLDFKWRIYRTHDDYLHGKVWGACLARYHFPKP